VSASLDKIAKERGEEGLRLYITQLLNKPIKVDEVDKVDKKEVGTGYSYTSVKQEDNLNIEEKELKERYNSLKLEKDVQVHRGIFLLPSNYPNRKKSPISFNITLFKLEYPFLVAKLTLLNLQRCMLKSIILLLQKCLLERLLCS